MSGYESHRYSSTTKAFQGSAGDEFDCIHVYGVLMITVSEVDVPVLRYKVYSVYRAMWYRVPDRWPVPHCNLRGEDGTRYEDAKYPVQLMEPWKMCGARPMGRREMTTV